jgi:hypothetical protein
MRRAFLFVNKVVICLKGRRPSEQRGAGTRSSGQDQQKMPRSYLSSGKGRPDFHTEHST